MRATIRSLMSSDADDLPSWVAEHENWALALRILAGPDDGPGEESFDITLCNVGWLMEKVRRDGIVDGRHHLIVEYFDWKVLRARVEQYVSRCDGATWDEVAEKLARFGHWEFEDYQP